MPRPAAQPDVPLSVAMQFELMTGREPHARLSGWVTHLQAGQYGHPTPDAVWRQHGDALTAEAHAAGFAPYWPRKQKPRGPAVDAWMAAFIQQHRY